MFIERICFVYASELCECVVEPHGISSSSHAALVQADA